MQTRLLKTLSRGAKPLLWPHDFPGPSACQRLTSVLLDALFPPRCAGCGRFGEELFCFACAPQLRKISQPLCVCCGAPFDPLAFSAEICALCRKRLPRFVAARAALVFEGPMRAAIHDFKYRRYFDDARRFAPLLAAVLQNDAQIGAQTFDFLVPIPLHSSRLRQRGFNQSARLAHELGRVCEIPVCEALWRPRKTRPQVGLSREERQKNVRDAIQISPKLKSSALKNTRILLIDDVFTTGATLDEAAKTLRRANVSEVFALTLARQLSPQEKDRAQRSWHEVWV